MPRGKKFTAEQIVGKRRKAEVGLAQGKTVPEVVLGQATNTQRRKACVADDEPQLLKWIVWMAREYGRLATAGLRPFCEPKAGV